MILNKMDLIGLSEFRQEGQGEVKSGQFTMLYSGKGNGIIVRTDVARWVQKVGIVNDRWMA